jgi:hypothetical protein
MANGVRSRGTYTVCRLTIAWGHGRGLLSHHHMLLVNHAHFAGCEGLIDESCNAAPPYEEPWSSPVVAQLSYVGRSQRKHGGPEDLRQVDCRPAFPFRPPVFTISICGPQYVSATPIPIVVRWHGGRLSLKQTARQRVWRGASRLQASLLKSERHEGVEVD